MNHSDDNILGLAPLDPNSGSGIEPSRWNNNSSIFSGRDIDFLNKSILQQKIFIELNSNKARFAVCQQLELDATSSEKYYGLASSVMNITEEARGKPCEPYCKAFNDRLLQLAARHTYGIVEVNAAMLGQEVMTKPIKPKTWLQLLLEK